jgi:uncharacterized Fe-S radical SAM superfamily protein PflX
MANERQLDIITDTEDKLWYELDGKPESRKGPFDTFTDMCHDLEKTLDGNMETELTLQFKEEKENDMSRVPNEGNNEALFGEVYDDDDRKHRTRKLFRPKLDRCPYCKKKGVTERFVGEQKICRCRYCGYLVSP